MDTQQSPQPARRILGGLVVRRERWGLSWRGKFLVLTVCVIAGWVMIHGVDPFLAVTDRKVGDILVVEGWVPTYSLKQAAAEYKQGHYQRVVVIRVVDDALGDKYESGRYNGGYIANILIENGIPKDLLETVFCAVARQDRTYNAALAVKRWLAQQHLPAQAINVVTLGPHARRSRLLYEKAFGSSSEIGIVAMEDVAYDKNHWWRSSEGVREVVGEAIAYGYVRFLFWPPSETP